MGTKPYERKDAGMSKKIKIVAIEGSMRPDNLTSKALAVVIDELRKCEGVSIEVIDPREMKLSFSGQAEDAPAKALQRIVKDATGVILSTPEYHGSYSSVIKLVIDNLGYPSALSGKPVALLGVASGQIGAIKALEHLRSVCSHIGAMVLPGPVSVAGVHKVFDAKGRCLDPKIESRLRGLATILMDYVNGYICPKKALEEFIREKENVK